MRARLQDRKAEDRFCFLCDLRMADKMEPVIREAGGEILSRDDRSYGVVMVVARRRHG